MIVGKKYKYLQITFGGVDAIEGDVDDPSQYEGAPANPQQFVAECCPQDLTVAVFVEQVEALGVVQTDQGGHGQTQQEDEEQAEVENLSHQSGLVQDLLLALVLQQCLVVVVVVGENAGERVQDQP